METGGGTRGSGGLFVALAVATLTACSGTSRAESPFDPPSRSQQTAAIVIDNENTNFSDLTVYLIPSSGARRRLGSVRLNERARFSVQRLSWGSVFRLVADPVGRRQIVSGQFVLGQGDLVEWNLSINSLSYRRSGGD